MKTKFNLPKKVTFCSKCVMSNQRPSSIAEFFHKPNRQGAKYLKKVIYVMLVNKMILNKRR